MTSLSNIDVYDYRTNVCKDRSLIVRGLAKNVPYGPKNTLARFLLLVGRMRKVKEKKGSILMEYLVVIFAMTALVLYFANNFYSFSDTAVFDPRIKPTGFYADASEVGNVSMNTETNSLFHGIHFVRFYQRTMGGVALPIP